MDLFSPTPELGDPHLSPTPPHLSKGGAHTPPADLPQSKGTGLEEEPRLYILCGGSGRPECLICADDLFPGGAEGPDPALAVHPTHAAVVARPCGHVFHSQCLEDHVEARRRCFGLGPRCPTCARELAEHPRLAGQHVVDCEGAFGADVELVRPRLSRSESEGLPFSQETFPRPLRRSNARRFTRAPVRLQRTQDLANRELFPVLERHQRRFAAHEPALQRVWDLRLNTDQPEVVQVLEQARHTLRTAHAELEALLEALRSTYAPQAEIAMSIEVIEWLERAKSLVYNADFCVSKGSEASRMLAVYRAGAPVCPPAHRADGALSRLAHRVEKALAPSFHGRKKAEHLHKIAPRRAAMIVPVYVPYPRKSSWQSALEEQDLFYGERGMKGWASVLAS